MPSISRRTLLRAGIGAAATAILAACGRDEPGGYVRPDDDAVRAAEARRNPGPVRDLALTATVGPVDLGGTTVTTWTYGGALPGTPIRIRVGERLRAAVTNNLPVETSVHWHGLALRNDADGVPAVTQEPIRAGARFDYEFTAAHAGTYWFHPHVGTQLDRGLYAPLIVEDPNDPAAYDDEWVIVLDDWLDGIAGDPDQVFAGLSGGSHGGSAMLMGASSYLLGGDAGDVRYPHYLLNGRLPAAPATFRARPASRIRLRIVNAGGDTAFRIALGGHRMQVTHADGFPVRPVETDALLLGMGERYDAVVELGDGVFPLVALAEGKNAAARAIVATGSGAVPPPSARPRELDGRIVGYRQLVPADAVRLPDRPADRTVTLRLTGSMTAYDWAFNNRPHDPQHIEAIREGERVRLELVNTTTMWHPVHLHGHTFAVGDTGVRKDTVIVLPGQSLPVSFDADNPGMWAAHCHNIYHAEAGMMTVFGYQR